MRAALPAARQRDGRRTLIHLGTAVVLLLGEGLVLGVSFHSQWIQGDAPWWGGLVSRVAMLPSFAVAFATAGLFLGREKLRDGWHAAIEVAGDSPRRLTWLLLGVHLVSFGAFVHLCSVALLSGGARVDTGFGLAWASSGGVAALALALWVLPARAIAVLLNRIAGVLVGAVAVAVVAWMAGNATMGLWWQPLRAWTFELVRLSLSFISSDVVADPQAFELGIGSFVVKVAPQCSGYEGIGLISSFLSVYLFVFRTRLKFPRALLLLPLGAALAWGANVLRIAALISLGAWVSPEVAIGGFHSYVGALTFCGLALGIAAFANRSPFFSEVEPDDSESIFASPTAARVVPLLAILVTTMSTGAVSVGSFDLLYPTRVLAAGGLLWLFRKHYDELRFTVSPVALGAGALVFALWLGLDANPTAPSDVEVELGQMSPGLAAVWLVFRALGAVVTVPIAEELAFRSYLSRRVQALEFWNIPLRHFSWAGFLISSVAFGAMHDRLLAGTVAGMVYALVAHRRGELGDAVVAHATTNGLLVVYVLVTGNWSAMT